MTVRYVRNSFATIPAYGIHAGFGEQPYEYSHLRLEAEREKSLRDWSDSDVELDRWADRRYLRWLA